MYIRKRNGIMEELPASPYMGTTWYEQRGYVAYAGALPLVRLDIVDGVVVELPEPPGPDTSAFDASCVSFRQVCAGIGDLIGAEEFRGGFDEMAVFQASPTARSEEGIFLALQWMSADKLCTYEAGKLGIGQPEWWYQCWNMRN